MSFEAFLQKEIQNIKDKNLYRQINTLDYPASKFVKIEGKEYLNLCSNNYLALADHPEIKQAAIQAINKYGTGSTGSRLITGTTPLHTELEIALARFKGTQSALYMSSGFIANISTIAALMTEQDVIFSDELNHASIIDGIRLSRANKFIYPHNDMVTLKELLQAHRMNYKNALIITDTIFSMDGDRARLENIVELKDKYNCILMIDEAHATGILGIKGSGLAEELQLTEKIDIHMGTFSKAAGVEGGYIAGSQQLIEYLRHKSRGFIYSTAPSPGMAGAVLKALEIISTDTTIRAHLERNISYFKQELQSLNPTIIKLFPTDSAIFCLHIGDTKETLAFQKRFMEHEHIFVSAIRPPTVKSSRIRICLNSALEINDLTRTIEAISKTLPTLNNL
jgi:8-amino-7-oxononanoate synthase